MSLRTLTVHTLLPGLLVSLMATVGLCEHGNPNPGVMPPQSHPLGKTYGEWGAAWWQWAVGDTPADMNPLLDETGEFGLLGDAGKVFFLAGNFGGETERTVVGVPNNKPIFFPILNSFNVATGPEDTEEAIRASVEADLDAVTSLEATVDGVELKDLFDYRADSPTFTVIANEGSILTEFFGLEPGPYAPAVSGGYWVMLSPLQKGDHVITFGGSRSDGFSLDVTYNLTVVGGNQTAVVPEPATAMLATLACLGFTVLCRKRRT